jgi:hypothetical protein
MFFNLTLLQVNPQVECTYVTSVVTQSVRSLFLVPSAQVLSIYDLSKSDSMHALTRMRKSVREQEKGTPEDIREAVSIVGGRLLYLNKVSKARDMAEMARHMLSVEKAWLLSQIGLIPDCDDDVMDEVRLFLEI